MAAGHYDRSRWDLAIEEFQTFLKKYPNDRRYNPAVFYLAEAQLQLGRTAEARRNFQTYLQLEPKGKFARTASFRAAEAAYLAGEFEAAKAELEGYLKEYPRDAWHAFVLTYLGNIALLQDDAKRAAEVFRRSLEQFPAGQTADECRLGLAQALEKLGQVEEAEKLYQTLAAKPDSPAADAAQFQLGALCYAGGRYEEALRHFAAFSEERRFSGSSWRPNALLGQALVLLKLDRPKDALPLLEVLMTETPADAAIAQQVWRARVQAALQMQDFTAVDQLVEQIEKNYSERQFLQQIRRLHARSFIQREQFAQAASLLENLTKADPNDLESRYLLAVSYQGLKQWDRAVEQLPPVMDKATGSLKADACLLYAALCMRQKNFDAAVSTLQTLLADKLNDETRARALGELAVCLVYKQKIAEAKSRYEEFSALLEKHPKAKLLAAVTEQLSLAAYEVDETAWSAELARRLSQLGDSVESELKGKLGLAWSQYKSGKTAEAAESFAEVLKRNPPAMIAVEAAFARGRACEELGRNEEALEMYQLLIEQYPESEQHAEALLAAAKLCEKLKQPQQAAVFYERLAQTHPKYEKLDAVLYDWAWALLEAGEQDGAYRLFQRLRQEHPQSRYWADATYRLAEHAFESRDWERAGRLLGELLAAESGAHIREYALLLSGRLSAEREDWPAAQKALQQLLEEYPAGKQRPAAEFWLAETYYRQGELATACERFGKLKEELQNTPRSLWMASIPLRYAQTLARLNRWEEAQTVAAAIEKDFPGFPQQYEVDYLLGRALANQADFEGARQAYERVIRSPTGARTETAAMAQWMIGESYFHQKDYRAALREYLRLEVLYDYPAWQAAALLQAGKCYELLGEPGQAAELYRRIVKLYGQTPFAKEAESRSARIGD